VGSLNKESVTDAGSMISGGDIAVDTSLDETTAHGASDILDVRKSGAVNSFRALLRHEEERIRGDTSTAALECCLRIEALKRSRARVNTTDLFTAVTRRQCILVGEDSAAARPQIRVFTALLVGSGGATTVLEDATRAVAKRIGMCANALVTASRIRKYTVKVTGISRAAGRLAMVGVATSLRVCATGNQ